MSIKKICTIGFIIGLSIPLFTFAQIKITEVMYDPLGSDTKREWIEVFNSGTTPIDLNTYFLFENNTNHRLIAQGGSVVDPGAYALIVDSIPEVLADFPNYSGLIFDSTFSLNNTGETISITNLSKEIIDTFTYASDMKGNDTGQSLQINNGAVLHASPTFGANNKTESEIIIEEATSTDSTSDSSSSSSDSTHSQQTGVSNYTPPTSFKVGAGRERIVSIYTPIDFEGYVSKNDIHIRYIWNFGDFNTDIGRTNTHIYEYPGIYEVILEGKSKDYTAISRTQVQVIEPQISIIDGTSTLSIMNIDSKELNLGGFRFIFEDGFLNIPRNTIIRGKGIITVPKGSNQTIKTFEYPNGKTYQNFKTLN